MFIIRHYVYLAILHYMSGGNPPNILTHVCKSFDGFYVQSVTSHLTEHIYLPAIRVFIKFILFETQ
jgi:hypothetical protein